MAAKFEADPLDMVAGEKSNIEASGALANCRFWSLDDPYLYDVYTILKVDGKVVDVVKSTTGFRKTEFKGGAGKGGVYINDKFVYLKGFAQRSTNEWAGLGRPIPTGCTTSPLADPRVPRKLRPLDARLAAAGRCRGVRPLRHRPSRPRGRQGKSDARPPVGAAAGSDARLDDLFSQ